ncbi:hypothetical protein HOV23_gp042 [Pseudomonas phage Lana]|uniref:DUF7352 domain-containing protein n=1 Tax=Pseudomonas phage Lana TaxID=2530172 RepID=A0A481W607_9CAUD|nr:hypothetical protein HOV23_gp042 [Pseudomonas phage Lana]QBJ04531.1 hypothetical protein [Pseudomonas phage Lana]
MNVLEIPGGLGGASVHFQPDQVSGVVQLWTMADMDKPTWTANVYLTVTGEELDIEHLGSFIGTVLLNGGTYAVHALLV